MREETVISVKENKGVMAIRLNGDSKKVLAATAFVITSISEAMDLSTEIVAGLVLSIIEDHKCLGRLEN